MVATFSNISTTSGNVSTTNILLLLYEYFLITRSRWRLLYLLSISTALTSDLIISFLLSILSNAAISLRICTNFIPLINSVLNSVLGGFILLVVYNFFGNNDDDDGCSGVSFGNAGATSDAAGASSDATGATLISCWLLCATTNATACSISSGTDASTDSSGIVASTVSAYGVILFVWLLLLLLLLSLLLLLLLLILSNTDAVAATT